MNTLDNKINKIILALRANDRIVTLSKPEFYSYKLAKFMKKYVFHEMTRKEVALRILLREVKSKIAEEKSKKPEEFPNKNKTEILQDLQEKMQYIKFQIKEIKLPPNEFLNKRDLILFLVKTLKSGDPNE